MWIALGWGCPLWAGTLQERVQGFPHWSDLPVTQPARGDLIYPDWFAGTWQVESTLVELEAPLAPAIVTPGFEGNRQYLHQTLFFPVRFLPHSILSQNTARGNRGRSRRGGFNSWRKAWQGGIPSQFETSGEIVADRAFNGLHITRAYLAQTGDTARVKAVRVNPQNPNVQITTLWQNQGNLQLVSQVTDRATEIPENDRFQFIATEISQQFFRSRPQVYLNRVETTTAYQWDTAQQRIHAEQFTAIYLSPQDPQYFEAINQPVALYHYHLELVPKSAPKLVPELVPELAPLIPELVPEF